MNYFWFSVMFALSVQSIVASQQLNSSDGSKQREVATASSQQERRDRSWSTCYTEGARVNLKAIGQQVTDGEVLAQENAQSKILPKAALASRATGRRGAVSDID